MSPGFKGGVGDEIIANPTFSLGVRQFQITLLAACIESGGLVVLFLFPGSYNADTFKTRKLPCKERREASLSTPLFVIKPSIGRPYPIVEAWRFSVLRRQDSLVARSRNLGYR